MENELKQTENKIIPKHGRGFYGIGIYGCKTPQNIGTLWRTALIFKADFMFTIGKRYKKSYSASLNSWKHIPLFEHDTFEHFYNALPKESKLIGVELDSNSVPLTGYTHPTRAVYILGAEDFGLPENVRRQCDGLIQLPGENSLNVAVAGSIVLYDRISKQIDLSYGATPHR